MKTSRLLSLLLCTLLMLTWQAETADAQTVVNYNYVVKRKLQDEKGKEIINEAKGFYRYYLNYSDAVKDYNKIVSMLKADPYLPLNDKEIKGDFILQGTPNGEFSFTGVNGMGVIFILEETKELILIQHNDGNWSNFNVRQTSGDNKFEFKCKRISPELFEYEVFIRGAIQLGETIHTGKYQVKGGNTRSSLDLGDNMERWTYSITLPKCMHEKDTRIIILPYAVDCNTEDTIDYLTPATYEGKDYHALQQKRKGFDYYKNDQLGKKRVIIKNFSRLDTIHRPDSMVVSLKKDSKGRSVIKATIGDSIIYEYDTLIVNNDQYKVHKWADTITSIGFIKHIEDLPHDELGRIVIDTLIEWEKPDPKKVYRGVLKVFMEDYHHVFYQLEDPGTCLRITPFKFLQMGAVAMDLKLTKDFYENALEKPSDAAESLDINFKHGTAEIIEDSAYFASMQKLHELVSDIEGKGGKILSAELRAYASPDGNDKINMELADKRAKAAKAKISIGSLAKVQIKTTPNIDTWEHTADMLDEAEYPAEAQVIRDALEKHNKNSQAAYQDIRKYPTYVDVIKPTLQKQCRIEFSAKYWVKKVLTPKEAVAAYYKKKNDNFSNGDYYNIFAELKDSAEIDTLTDIVYKRLIKRGKQYDRPIATYVMNKMALLSIKRGVPDSTILQPLINENNGTVRLYTINKDFSGIREDYTQNRPEILLNQAVIFYLLEKKERAKFFVDMLELNGWTSDELIKLKHYLTFKLFYGKSGLTRQQQEAFNNSIEYVAEADENNRAVLYTEFDDLHRTELAWPYVMKMKDTNPIKWYLLGLLWAKRNGREILYPLPEAESLRPRPEGVDWDVNINGYPYYIAYFQKCFEIDKNFKKHYFKEGNVSEEMRKKRFHAYKEKRIPQYHKIFALRYYEDKKNTIKLDNLSSSDDKKDKKD